MSQRGCKDPPSAPSSCQREGRCGGCCGVLSPLYCPLPKQKRRALRAWGGGVLDGGSACEVQMCWSAHQPQLERLCHHCWCGAVHAAAFQFLGYGQGSETDAGSCIPNPKTTAGLGDPFVGFRFMWESSWSAWSSAWGWVMSQLEA